MRKHEKLNEPVEKGAAGSPDSLDSGNAELSTNRLAALLLEKHADDIIKKANRPINKLMRMCQISFRFDH